MSDAEDHSALNWIKDDLDATLHEARQALEECEEGSGDTALLEVCGQRLHQIHGVLEMVQLYGPAMLAEEMEQVAGAILEDKVRGRGDAAEALMLAMIQLPDYLEKLQAGDHDIPLVILPQLNDLRAVRNAPLLTEASLFSPELDQGKLPEQVTGEANVQLPEIARRLRLNYHKGLIGWYRGVDAEASLRQVADVIGELRDNAHTEPVHALFQVGDALVRGLLEQSITAGAAVKSLFGQLDRMMKLLIDQGEEGVSRSSTRELLQNMLYYVARADSREESVKMVQDSYRLASALPSETEVAAGRARLQAPNSDAFDTVKEIIGGDLTRVKDELDLYIRGDTSRSRDLLALESPIRKLADTLGMLGQGALRVRLNRQADRLVEMGQGESGPDEMGLMQLAGELLLVESSLANVTVGPAGADRLPDELSDAEAGALLLPRGELKELIKATLREAHIDMARVKDAIVAFIDEPAVPGVLTEVTSQLRNIGGALRMLSLSEPAAMLDAISGYVQTEIVEPGRLPEREHLNAFADAITAVEYFMEAMLELGRRRDDILDIARAALLKLGRGSAVEPIPQRIEEPEEAAAGGGDLLAQVLLGDEQAVTDEQAAGVASQAEAGEQLEEALDQEILEIFVEEAREELEVIQEKYGLWKQNPDDRDALTRFRRSFHTLKGSGRLVGATAIAELAWSLENMLNRVIDETLPVTPEVLEILDASLEQLPGLIERQVLGGAPLETVQGLMERAFAAAGTAAPESAEETGPEALETPPEPGLEPGLAMDQELFEIFDEEAKGHLDLVQGFIGDARMLAQPVAPSEELYRVLHTLHGSANMAQVGALGDLSQALEKLVKVLWEAGEPVDTAVLGLLEEGVDRMRAQLAAINVPGIGPVPENELIGRVDELREQRLAGLAQQAEREPEAPEPVPFTRDRATAAGERVGEDELVDVFLEEAQELVERLDTALADWRRDPQNHTPLTDLQRTLHTLKGGARLAGLSAVGDLGHAFESLLTGLSEGRLRATDEVQELAQQAADRLSSQLDEVKALRPIEPEQDLIRRLEALTAETEESEETGFPSPEPAAEIAVEPSSSGEPAETESPQGAAVVALFESERKEAAPTEGDAAGTAQAAPQRMVAESAPLSEPKLPPKREQVRVRSDVLDRLVNNAGEVSIYRARLEQQNSAIGFNLSELEQTVERLRQQLRQLEIETEAQILFRYEREREEQETSEQAFDPLELDRFSTMQQVSRSLMETVNDLVSIKGITEDLHQEMDTLLTQQSRVTTDLQDGLLRTRMVPFTQVVSRLQRVVRQTCVSTAKQAELAISGAEVEVDRGILERMIGPLEHILRNAVSHGIESADERHARGKDQQGRINLDVTREGTDVVMTLTDDGQGLKLDSIRRRAIEKGLLAEGADVAGSDIMQFILEPGFTTADELSQIAGRGVGMDVVASEVKQLGGSLDIESEAGAGSRFTIRLPLTLAISEALLVQMEEEIYAIPHTSIEGVVRISREELLDLYEGRREGFDYAGQTYLMRNLGAMLGTGAVALPEGRKWLPLLLVRTRERRMALQVDLLLGNRQIVVKSVGPQLSTVRWITGGTILGDGRVALILDVNALVRMEAAKPLPVATPRQEPVTGGAPVRVMVVDDSITVRKVTGRLLERYNFQVMTAKDGVDAVALLQEQVPDLILLDIEMPRMDGFEFARHLRNSPNLKQIPIIMITSRTGDKHRRLAMELGVKRYLGKPYQEMELLDNIYSILAETRA